MLYRVSQSGTFCTVGKLNDDRTDAVRAAASQAWEVNDQIAARDRLLHEAWLQKADLRQLAKETGMSRMTIKRIVDRISRQSKEDTMSVRDTWSQYENRYSTHRQETYDAYVDVWKRDSQVRSLFTGWASFSQAANDEPAQSDDRVQTAEECMIRCGYKLLPPTSRGGRRWGRA